MARLSVIRSAVCALILVFASLAHAGPGDWGGQGPFGGSIVSLQADPTVPTRLYAATSNGFFRSDDAGTSWGMAETGLLDAHPTNGVFAIAPSGKLWMFDDAGRFYGSSDAGNNWIPTGYVFPPAAPSAAATIHRFNAIAQGSGASIWFAAGTSGLLLSSNNGASFATAGGAGFPAGATVSFVATNPANPLQVIAGLASGCNAATGACAVYYSINGGSNWTLSTISGVTSFAGANLQLVAVGFSSASVVYALYGYPTVGEFFNVPAVLLSSTNGGASWTAHAQTGASLATTTSSTTTVWVDANKSTTSGASFTPLSTSGRTTNGVLVPGTNAFAVAPNYPATTRLWVGTQYAGIYLSNDDGATWASSNDGMAATDIRTVVVHPNDNTRLFAGFGDSISDPSQAFYRSTSSGTWNISNSGLGAFQLRTILIDPTTAASVGSTVIYAVGSGGKFPTRNSGIYKSLDGGLTWATQNGGIPPQSSGNYAGGLRTIIADPRSCTALPAGTHTGPVCASGPLKTLYVTGAGVHSTVPPTFRVMKSTDGGANWASSESGLPADIIGSGDAADYVGGVTPIVMDPSDSNILYIGTFAFANDAVDNPLPPTVASGVYRSNDAGATWHWMSTGLPTYAGAPAGAVPGASAVLDTLSLAIDSAHPSTLWVSTKDLDINSGTPGEIYKTTDGGAHWTVSNAGISGPDVRALLADPSNPGTIYAASGGLGPANPGGVYKSTDGGATWMSISVGLPAYSATALTLDPVDPTVLYAGTNGGVYSIVQLPDSDADGVPDLIENSGPNGGDANHDNSQDSVQNFVGTSAPGLFGGYGWQVGSANASQSAQKANLQQKIQAMQAGQAQSGIQGGYFTVQVGGGTCTQAVDVSPINPGPLGLDTVSHHGTYTYPRGLVRFELPQCDAATVDLMFNAATFGSGWSWRYYGPSIPGDNSTMGWHDATSLVNAQTGIDWQIKLLKGAFGSYRPAVTGSILFEGGPSYNDTIFNDTE